MSAPVSQATAAMHRRMDGSRWISFRPIEPSDEDALIAFYAALSAESRRRRFLNAGPVPEPLVRGLASVPGTVGVLREMGPNDGAIVAHASVQPGHVGDVEVAFAVADAHQRRGIGRLLVAASIDLAHELGATTASATLLADNTAMRRLLLSAGSPVREGRLEAGTEEIVLDLTATS